MRIFLKRKYQTLCLILIVGIIFYLLQALTMSQLGHASRKMEASKFINNILNSDDIGDDESNPVLISRNRIIDGDSKFYMDAKEAQFIKRPMDKEDMDIVKMKQADNDDKKKEEATKNLYLENNYIKEANDKNRIRNRDMKKNNLLQNKGKHGLNATIHGNSNSRRPMFVRGVHPSDAMKYKLDNSNMFHCLKDSEVRIRGEQINDDFCDCPDSSDEPGTSACPDGRFYCGRQIPGSSPQFVPSSRVGDGVCDCCDGSDEWQGELVPDFIRIRAGEPRAVVDHAPCGDRCGDILVESRQNDALVAQGKRLQVAYLKQADLELRERDKLKYGPGGVFFSLSKQCFTLKADHYNYNVCPFQKVTQSAVGGGKVVVLGKTPSIQQQQQHQGQGHVLVMSGGESHLCPFGKARTAKIEMMCGLQDVLKHVQESELCVYTFTLMTPAAC